MANKLLTKAVFIDRDGTIVKDTGYLHEIKKLQFIGNSIKALQILSKTDYKIIIITNQAGIARGYYTEKIYSKFTKEFLKILKSYIVKINAVYYCPHHPIAGLGKYKKLCKCRKPNIGMITRATKKFNIDMKKSWFIGDTTADILTGKNAGCKTILVKTGYAGKDKNFNIKPDYIKNNLFRAVKLILKKNKQKTR